MRPEEFMESHKSTQACNLNLIWRRKGSKPYNQPVPFVLINRLLILLGAVGLFITSTLTYAHMTATLMPCGAGSACDALWARAESKVLGIPVAYLGLAGYFILFVLAGVRAIGPAKLTPLATKAGLVISGIGFLMSCYLVYALVVVIQLKCEWCFGSAITMTLTFILHLLLSRTSRPEGEPGMIDATLVPFSFVAALGISYAMLADRPKGDPLLNAKADQLVFERLVPDSSYTTGNPSARIQLVEIADFYCPACRSMAPIVDQIKGAYGDKVGISYRSLPLFKTPGHENSLAASLAAEYARQKGKYWLFLKAIFSPGATDKIRSDIALAEVLDDLGLNGDEWLKTYQSQSSSMFESLDQGLKLFDEAGINTTPTFVVYIDRKSPVVVDSQRLAVIFQSTPYKEILAGGTN